MSLEMEVRDLRATLQDKEEIIIQTAQIGKQLLETNLELEKQLEDATKAHTERIEELEQEKHSLQLKCDCHSSNLEALRQELDSLHSQLDDKHQDELKRLEEVYSKKAHDEAVLNEDLKADIDKLEVQLKMVKEKNKLHEETIEQLKEDISCKANSTILQHELKDLEQLYLDEHSKCEDLQVQLMEAEGNAEVLVVEREGLLVKVASLEEECQERCRLANEWFESLKEVKDINVSLKSELELIKLEQKRGFHGARGNSLFGEVEDKRVEAQRKLISLQVKLDSLEKTHSTTKQRYTRLKAEMSALFCRYSATTADSEHLQRLQRALSQSNSENEGLRSKIHKLETQLAEGNLVQDKRKLMSAFVDFGDKAEYIQFLEHEIDQGKESHTAVLKELDMKRTQMVWESNKLSEAESKLYHSEQQSARRKEDITKLRLKLQETLEKLNQSDTKIAQIEAEKNFLEQELKSRGHRHSLAPRQGQDSNTRGALTNTSHHSNTSVCSTSDQSVYSSGSTDSVKKSDTSASSSDRSQIEPAQPRVINLLEELDAEFSKQKKDGVCGGESKVNGGDENTRPLPMLQSKVVHVSNKENVNQCSQQ